MHPSFSFVPVSSIRAISLPLCAVVDGSGVGLTYSRPWGEGCHGHSVSAPWTTLLHSWSIAQMRALSARWCISTVMTHSFSRALDGTHVLGVCPKVACECWCVVACVSVHVQMGLMQALLEMSVESMYERLTDWIFKWEGTKDTSHKLFLRFKEWSEWQNWKLIWREVVWNGARRLSGESRVGVHFFFSVCFLPQINLSQRFIANLYDYSCDVSQKNLFHIT